MDWKAGGQVNYLADFGDEWWFRWQQTMAGRFKTPELAKYDGLGIQYIVLKPEHRLAQPAMFENGRYLCTAPAKERFKEPILPADKVPK